MRKEEGVLRIALRMKGRELKAVARWVGRAIGGFFPFVGNAVRSIYHVVDGAPRAFTRAVLWAVRGVGRLLKAIPRFIPKIPYIVLILVMTGVIPAAALGFVGWAWFVSGLSLISKVLATIGAVVVVLTCWNLAAALAVRYEGYSERIALWDAGELVLFVGGLTSFVGTIIAAALGFLDPGLVGHWQWACVILFGGGAMMLASSFL
jgi:hypothetical protein